MPDTHGPQGLAGISDSQIDCLMSMVKEMEEEEANEG